MTQPFKIWFVKDMMSGDCIDGRYFSTKDEAVARRNELGYGYVCSHEHEVTE